jgi:hypothetical protein
MDRRFEDQADDSIDSEDNLPEDLLELNELFEKHRRGYDKKQKRDEENSEEFADYLSQEALSDSKSSVTDELHSRFKKHTNSSPRIDFLSNINTESEVESSESIDEEKETNPFVEFLRHKEHERLKYGIGYTRPIKKINDIFDDSEYEQSGVIKDSIKNQHDIFLKKLRKSLKSNRLDEVDFTESDLSADISRIEEKRIERLNKRYHSIKSRIRRNRKNSSGADHQNELPSETDIDLHLAIFEDELRNSSKLNWFVPPQSSDPIVQRIFQSSIKSKINDFYDEMPVPPFNINQMEEGLNKSPWKRVPWLEYALPYIPLPVPTLELLDMDPDKDETELDLEENDKEELDVNKLDKEDQFNRIKKELRNYKILKPGSQMETEEQLPEVTSKREYDVTGKIKVVSKFVKNSGKTVGQGAIKAYSKVSKQVAEYQDKRSKRVPKSLGRIDDLSLVIEEKIRFYRNKDGFRAKQIDVEAENGEVDSAAIELESNTEDLTDIELSSPTETKNKEVDTRATDRIHGQNLAEKAVDSEIDLREYFSNKIFSSYSEYHDHLLELNQKRLKRLNESKNDQEVEEDSIILSDTDESNQDHGNTKITNIVSGNHEVEQVVNEEITDEMVEPEEIGKKSKVNKNKNTIKVRENSDLTVQGENEKVSEFLGGPSGSGGPGRGSKPSNVQISDLGQRINGIPAVDLSSYRFDVMLDARKPVYKKTSSMSNYVYQYFFDGDDHQYSGFVESLNGKKISVIDMTRMFLLSFDSKLTKANLNHNDRLRAVSLYFNVDTETAMVYDSFFERMRKLDEDQSVDTDITDIKSIENLRDVFVANIKARNADEKELFQILIMKIQAEIYGPSIVAEGIAKVYTGEGDWFKRIPVGMFLNLHHDRLALEEKQFLADNGLIALDGDSVRYKTKLLSDYRSVSPLHMVTIIDRIRQMLAYHLDAVFTGTDIQSSITSDQQAFHQLTSDDKLNRVAAAFFIETIKNFKAELKYIKSYDAGSFYFSSKFSYKDASSSLLRPRYRAEVVELLSYEHGLSKDSELIKRITQFLPEDKNDNLNTIGSLRGFGLHSIDRILRDHRKLFTALGIIAKDGSVIVDYQGKSLINWIFRNGDVFNGKPSLFINKPRMIRELHNHIQGDFLNRMGRMRFSDLYDPDNLEEKEKLSVIIFNYLLSCQNRIEMANLYQLFIDGRQITVKNYGLTLSPSKRSKFNYFIADKNISQLLKLNINHYEKFGKINIAPPDMSRVVNLVNNQVKNGELQEHQIYDVPGIKVSNFNGRNIFLIADLESISNYKLHKKEGFISFGVTHKLIWDDYYSIYREEWLSDRELTRLNTLVLSSSKDFKDLLSIIDDRISYLDHTPELKRSFESYQYNILKILKSNHGKVNTELLQELTPVLNQLNFYAINLLRKNIYKALHDSEINLSSAKQLNFDFVPLNSPEMNLLVDIVNPKENIIGKSSKNIIYQSQKHDDTYTIGSIDQYLRFASPFSLNVSFERDFTGSIYDDFLWQINTTIKRVFTGEIQSNENEFISELIQSSINRLRSPGNKHVAGLDGEYLYKNINGSKLKLNGEIIKFKVINGSMDNEMLKVLLDTENENLLSGRYPTFDTLFLQLKSDKAKKLMQKRSKGHWDTQEGRVFTVILYEIIDSNENSYQYLKKLLMSFREASSDNIYQKLSRLFAVEMDKVPDPMKLNDDIKNNFTIGEKRRLNEVFNTFIQRRFDGLSDYDIQNLSNPEFLDREELLKEVKNNFSCIVGRGQVVALHLHTGTTMTRSVDGYSLRAKENHGNLGLMMVSNLPDRKIKKDSNPIIRKCFSVNGKGKDKLIHLKIRDTFDSTTDPPTLEDIEKDYLNSVNFPKAIASGSREVFKAAGEIRSTLRYLFQLGSYLDIGPIEDYYAEINGYYSKMSFLKIIKEITPNSMSSVAENEMIWRIFISDVIGVDRSAMISYYQLPHPSVKQPDGWQTAMEYLEFIPSYKSEIWFDAVRFLINQKTKDMTKSDVLYDINGDLLVSENAQTSMTIKDLALSPDEYSRIIPDKYMIFVDRMHIANLLETRMISQEQATEFIQEWKNIIGFYRDTERNVKGGRMTPLMKIFETLKLDIDDDSAYQTNDKLAEFLSHRFAPPTMNRDPISGKWTKVLAMEYDPEKKMWLLNPESSSTFTQSSSDQFPFGFFMNMYKNGLMEIFVEGTQNALEAKIGMKEIIEIYDEILKGNNIKDLKSFIEKLNQKDFSFQSLYGINSMVSMLDDVRKEIK